MPKKKKTRPIILDRPLTSPADRGRKNSKGFPIVSLPKKAKKRRPKK